jgi:hypothetical protein
VVLLSACTVTPPIAKSVAYKRMYEEKPVTILLMPPINRSLNVDAKEYFHSTLNIPIANAGYYVIPPFLSMDILKQESAYDAELFLDMPLNKFEEVFGADLALFTIINRWNKNGINSVFVEVEYIFKSTKTNETVYQRKAHITCDTSVNTGVGGTWGALANLVASAVNTAVTKHVDVARRCNEVTFQDLPAGKYSPNCGLDGSGNAGAKEFKASVRLN